MGVTGPRPCAMVEYCIVALADPIGSKGQSGRTRPGHVILWLPALRIGRN